MRDAAHEREFRQSAERNFDAERKARGQAEARTAAETKRADEAEDRVKVLETVLQSKQLVDEIAAERGEGSEVERVAKLRAEGGKAPSPAHPAPAAPARDGRGIGEQGHRACGQPGRR